MSCRVASKRIGFLFGVALLASCASAEGPDPAPEPAADMGAAPTPEMIAEGEQIFGGAGRCSVCHGPAQSGADSVQILLTTIGRGLIQPAERRWPISQISSARGLRSRGSLILECLRWGGEISRTPNSTRWQRISSPFDSTL